VPLPWEHIFGFGAWYTYPFPVDPDFREDEGVLGYRTVLVCSQVSLSVPASEGEWRRRVRAKGWR
jgi:hypothetical protein